MSIFDQRPIISPKRERRRAKLRLMLKAMGAAMEEDAVNLITAPTDFSDAAWNLSNVTVDAAGTADQAIVEDTTDNTFFQVWQEIAKPEEVATYRFTCDCAPGTGRDWLYLLIFGSTFNDENLNLFYDVGDPPAVGDPSGSGIETLSKSATALGGGVVRCAVNFTTLATDSLQIWLGIATGAGGGGAQHVGEVGNSLKITNVVLNRLD